MNENAIFLDIDDTITSYFGYRKKIGRNQYLRMDYPSLYYLRKLVQEFDASFVLCSSYPFFTREDPDYLLWYQSFHEFGLKLSDKVEHNHKDVVLSDGTIIHRRVFDILEYLLLHEEILHFVCLDDTNLGTGLKNFYVPCGTRCSYDYSFSFLEYEEARKAFLYQINEKIDYKKVLNRERKLITGE